MQVPVKWLNDYVGLEDVDFDELREKVSLNGMKIESIETLFDRTNKIEVGRIAEIESHPDAESLVVIQVDVGEEEAVQIVTGATNCSVGKYAPIVRKNGRIADGTKIKKGRLRGVESFGMLCSLEELGYSPDIVPESMYDNIYILEDHYGAFVPGMAITEAVPELRDSVITLAPDTEMGGMSMQAIARELASALELDMKPVKTESGETMGKDQQPYRGKLGKDGEDGFDEKYAVRRVFGVPLRQSPDWLKLRLMKTGIRPVNLIRDVGSYVEMEFGEMVHLYDMCMLGRPDSTAEEAQAAIEVSDASAGETRNVLILVKHKDGAGISQPSGASGVDGAGQHGNSERVADRVATLLESLVLR